MSNYRKFYIDGAWQDPVGKGLADVINPATEELVAQVALGSREDVDRAVRAAKAAFPKYAALNLGQRLSLLRRVLAEYQVRHDDIAAAISMEMGAPHTLAFSAQAATGIGHLKKMIDVMESYQFEKSQGRTRIMREPVGVCGLITPWNWPINQIICKVAPALAAGCTMVLKPSEVSPLSALLFAEVMDAAGVPPGVFNLVNGDGPTVGQAISSHPDVDMVSFTGSTRAGVAVAKAAADTVKRVHQELGGKSANILLPDADLEKAIPYSVRHCFRNSGQSCSAPTRVLVHRRMQAEVLDRMKSVAESLKIGDPNSPDTELGPVVNATQYDRVQQLIQSGIAEGARLVTGGPGRPAGLNCGYYVRPTIFGDVRPNMTIAFTEIFGPVLVVLPYDTEEEAIDIANGTDYGLAAYVQSADHEHARRVAVRLRAGQVHLNGGFADLGAPFGGYKRSGNGREQGQYGLEEFTELKAVLNFEPA